MDNDLAARIAALLVAGMVASSHGEKDHLKILAYADTYMDFLKPFSLKVSSAGEVTFTPDAEGTE